MKQEFSRNGGCGVILNLLAITLFLVAIAIGVLGVKDKLKHTNTWFGIQIGILVLGWILLFASIL